MVLICSFVAPSKHLKSRMQTKPVADQSFRPTNDLLSIPMILDAKRGRSLKPKLK